MKKKNNSRNVTISNQALRVIQQETPNKQKQSTGDSIRSPRQRVLSSLEGELLASLSLCGHSYCITQSTAAPSAGNGSL